MAFMSRPYETLHNLLIGGGDAMKPTAATVARDGAAAAEPANAHSADDRAATTIQAVYRGFRARKYVETVHAAAAKIQAGFRGYRVRQSLKNHAAPPSTTDDSQCWSEDDDQKSVVSVAHRPPPPPAADAAECGRDEGAGTLPVPAADAVLTSAAVKIQARVRGFAARKRLNGDRNGKLQ